MNSDDMHDHIIIFTRDSSHQNYRKHSALKMHSNLNHGHIREATWGWLEVPPPHVKPPSWWHQCPPCHLFASSTPSHFILGWRLMVVMESHGP